MLLSCFKAFVCLLVSRCCENASGAAACTSGCTLSSRCGLPSGCDVGSRARGSGGTSACSLVAQQGFSYNAAHGILAPQPGVDPSCPLPWDADSQSLDHQRSSPVLFFNQGAGWRTMGGVFHLPFWQSISWSILIFPVSSKQEQLKALTAYSKLFIFKKKLLS